ncbi:hypothetical protein G6F68_009168 [Rhizopus microsporus]|nr:hypothetical protein G6F67_008534 [Rhizopus microsporus]KAG1257718.1 hypothetical protein G6F68_009168 [Rhizopus microsporus]
MLQVPEFKQQFEDMLINVTKQLMNPTATNDHINSLADMLQEDVAWDAVVPRMLLRYNVEMSKMFNVSNGRIPPDFDMASALRQISKYGGNGLFGNNMAASAVSQDFNKTLDFSIIVTKGLPFREAVNGPTGNSASMGVKEFINTVIFEIQQDSAAIENITGSILQLKDQLNEFLTQIMEKETLPTNTTTTKDDIEEQEDEEQDKDEDGDSPMSIDRPEAPEKQNVKKPKINEK